MHIDMSSSQVNTQKHVIFLPKSLPLKASFPVSLFVFFFPRLAFEIQIKYRKLTMLNKISIYIFESQRSL